MDEHPGARDGEDERVRALHAALRALADGDLGTRAAPALADPVAAELLASVSERCRALAARAAEAERRSRVLAREHGELAERAERLALASLYKSEFLANVSHELRAPLNILLILSQQLLADTEHELAPKQREFVRTIHDSGRGLLALINDILDLAKIESGTVAVAPEELALAELVERLERAFRPVAEEKGLAFELVVEPACPESFATDAKRLEQVLKNLLSNAFKFTDSGRVELAVRLQEGVSAPGALHAHAATVLAFAVRDTGIGIPPAKHALVFEAFQQAEAGTNRRYGGTGLGLTISRDLARLLGGKLTLASTPGEGSTFTLLLPLAPPANGSAPAEPPERVVSDAPAAVPAPALPARADVPGPPPSLLVVDGDAAFACALRDLATERGAKALITLQGGVALELARRYLPTAITLAQELPDMSGVDVLARLAGDAATRHIPVHVLAARTAGGAPRASGAASVAKRPVGRAALRAFLERVLATARPGAARLLVAAGDEPWAAELVHLLEGAVPVPLRARTGAEALALAAAERVDCAVVAHELADVRGVALLADLGASAATPLAAVLRIPAAASGSLALGAADERAAAALAPRVRLRRASALDRLLDEVVRALRLPVQDLPPEARELVLRLHRPAAVLAGRSVLVVDDDPRNVLALTSVLERHGVRVRTAGNGPDALAMLAAAPEIEAVLMDVMMPGMDGNEAIRAVRREARFAELPIVALTARAMPGDREACLAAGASAYAAKPVDVEQLLALLSLWLHR